MGSDYFSQLESLVVEPLPHSGFSVVQFIFFTFHPGDSVCHKKKCNYLQLNNSVARYYLPKYKKLAFKKKLWTFLRYLQLKKLYYEVRGL